MERYEKYKDSGVEWIGEIPVGWQVNVLKRFAKICNGQDHKKVWDENGDYPIIGSGGVFGKANKFLYDQPSVILGRKGTIDKPRYINTPFWTVDTAYYTDIFPTTDERFFFYLCLTIDFELYKYGSAVPSMNQETLSQIPFTSPLKAEQTVIANYLDRKTSEIDQFIAQKERLLALYEEEKTAIIHQAVTQGINPDVKLKESGIDWLGKIPPHWEVSRMKNICKVRQGLQISISERIRTKTKNSLPYITIKAINNPDNTTEYIEFPAANVVCKTDDILVARTGATGEIITGIEGVFHNNFFLVDYVRSIIDKDFLVYYLKSRLIKEYLLLIAGTTTIPDLNHNDFYCTPFFLFSKSEQIGIVHHIETETTRINAKIAKTEKIIALQKEYRTALISEVVTGKIKVTQKKHGEITL